MNCAMVYKPIATFFALYHIPYILIFIAGVRRIFVITVHESNCPKLRMIVITTIS